MEGFEKEAVQTIPRPRRQRGTARSRKVVELPEAETSRTYQALISGILLLAREVEVVDISVAKRCRGCDGVEVAAREGETAFGDIGEVRDDNVVELWREVEYAGHNAGVSVQEQRQRALWHPCLGGGQFFSCTHTKPRLTQRTTITTELLIIVAQVQAQK
jgi:hypothetical protein